MGDDAVRVAASANAPLRVAAVVVHFGDPAPTRRCLDSLEGIDEVILVDQPPERFGGHPRITKRIEPAENIGFAAACNRAVEATDAPFVLLLNNDAQLEPGAAQTMRAALPGLAPDVAGVCLKLLCMDGVTLQSAGGLWFTRDGIGFPHGFGERDDGQYDALPANEVGVPSGAAAVYRTSAWRDAGGMSEEFFCYCEDGDLGLRLIASGHRFDWLPDVRVRHELSSSTGAHSLLKAYHVERNHFAAIVHSAPLSSIAMMPLRTMARLLLTAADVVGGRGAGHEVATQSGARRIAITLASAWRDALRMIPRATAKRRALIGRNPDGAIRVERFLATRRVSIAEFLRERV